MATKKLKKELDISGTVDKPKKKKKRVDAVVPELKTKKKKVVPVVVDKPKKKKKKKKAASTELSLVNTRRRISKLDGSLTSIIGDSTDAIQQLLEDNNNESASSLVQKRLMQTLVDIIPMAENAIRQSGGAKGVYAFNSLITSIRELMIDIQSTRDKGQIGDMMVEKVVRPAFLDLGMNLVTEDARMLKEIKDLVTLSVYDRIKEVHEGSLSRTAKFIQDKYAEAKGQAITFMQH